MHLPAQHRHLMAEHQQFDVLGPAVAGELGQHLQHLAQQQVHQRSAHGLHRAGHAGVDLAQNRTSDGEPSIRAPQVEENFQAAKGQVGLDQHQVRRWDSWHRFTTLALAALAVLAICAADAADHDPTDTGLIKLTVNEVRRLINTLIIRAIRDLADFVRWSQWRRRHKARARRAPYRRRLNLELQP